jgi:quercetin dioxygenase-like cupin family protein
MAHRKATTMAELIQLGVMQIRFLRTKYDTSGALDMFEVAIPPNSRMPVPHHHRDWEETIYGLDGVVTWTIAGKRIEIKQGDDCSPSAPLRQIEGLHEGRISGSS